MNEGGNNCRNGSANIRNVQKGILMHYYLTHIDADVAHIPTHSQKQPGSEALEWLSQMEFFFFFICNQAAQSI